jgi:hypothetical protein
VSWPQRGLMCIARSISQSIWPHRGLLLERLAFGKTTGLSTLAGPLHCAPTGRNPFFFAHATNIGSLKGPEYKCTRKGAFLCFCLKDWCFVDSTVWSGNRTPVESEIRVRSDVNRVYDEQGLRRIGVFWPQRGPMSVARSIPQSIWPQRGLLLERWTGVWSLLRQG